MFFFLCFFFFFFQAEDGIRDLYVTGVQTCALPISATVERVGAVSSPAPTTATLNQRQSCASPAGIVASPSRPSSSQVGSGRVSDPYISPPVTEATPNTATTAAAQDTWLASLSVATMARSTPPSSVVVPNTIVRTATMSAFSHSRRGTRPASAAAASSSARSGGLRSAIPAPPATITTPTPHATTPG